MQEPEEAENAFTYFSYGAKVEIFMTVATGTTTLAGVSETVQKDLFKRDLLQCSFGFANPGYKLTMAQYC